MRKTIVLKAPVRTPARNDAIELLRYVCAIGIVWFHLGGPYAWVGHAALIVFIILSVNFALAQDLPTWGRKRVLSLWLFWSVIYAALKIVQSVVHGQDVIAEFEWWMLITGPALPLWFLPFIYVANGAATSYNRRVGGRTSWIEVLMLPCLTLVSIALIPLSPGVPFSQWLLGASGVFMAIALFRAKHDMRYLVALAVMLTCAFLAGIDHESRMLLFALCVAALALSGLPDWQSAFAGQLGAISLGVYVLHPGVSAAFKAGIHSFPIVVQICVVALVSTVLALVMRRLPVFGKFI